MAERRNWGKVVTYLAGASLVLLIAQYFLGLWSNVYAPAQFLSFYQGVDAGANYPPALFVHITVADVLFILSIVALVFAALARQLRLIIPALVLVVSIYVAGEFGMAFVNSTPNDPIDSFGMGTMFLVALFATMGILALSRSRRTPSAPSAAPAATQTQPS
ncbi:MAG: hypothetical protein WCB18_07660 [Thermoplasmata archaeon]